MDLIEEYLDTLMFLRDGLCDVPLRVEIGQNRS